MSQAQKATTTTTTAVAPPIWSCETHKRNHYQQRELKQQQQHLRLSTLSIELRHATNLWFQAKSKDCFQLLVQTCVQILQHGLLQPTTDAAALRFIEDFEFLRLTELQQHPHSPAPQRSKSSDVTGFLQQWVHSCLQTKCLCRCLQSLVADKELLEAYYPRDVAYLRQSEHATTLFVCLTAIQLDQRSLLSQLEPLHRRRHRRTSSQPNFSSCQLQRLHAVQEEEEPATRNQPLQRTLLRRNKSLPNLGRLGSSEAGVPGVGVVTPTYVPRPRCQTWGTQELSGCSLSSSSTCSQLTGTPTSTATPTPTPRRIQLINCDDIKIWTDQSNASDKSSTNIPAAATVAAATTATGSLNSFLGNLFGHPAVYTSWYNHSLSQAQAQAQEGSSVLDSFLPINGRKLDKRQQQSLFEGVSMLDYQPQEEIRCSTAPLSIVGSGEQLQLEREAQRDSNEATASCSSDSNSQSKLDNQSFAAFLQMSRYGHNNNTELEKENAHFLISEACITAIEHVKWSSRSRGGGGAAGDERSGVEGCGRLTGGGEGPEAAGEVSKSGVHHGSEGTGADGATVDGVAGQAATAADADALLMPYAEQQNNSTSNNNSAEAVGLQLISRFKDQQLPKLGDLKWLVSEQDAPQQLLPMPKLESPLPAHEESSLTRGTRTWAPPRQQIIFTEHPLATRSQLLTRQHYRCAGCGMHVQRQLQQHFRYCNYLGKYLCTGCHRNQLSAIPAKILQSWDFRCYPVSSFAYRLIEQMYTFPLFHVPDLHPQLYGKSKALAKARKRRQQLQHVRDFIAACRFATREQALFNAVPAHITSDPDMWSMCDFVDVQNSSMRRSIEELIALSEQHISCCVLCTGRAFVCEYCKSPKLIYRWQRKVQRCAQCGACSHFNCWKAHAGGNCQRCNRLHQRLAAMAPNNSNNLVS